MTVHSASHSRRDWTLVVRRSFGIPDLVPEHQARGALVESLEQELRNNGWQSAARSIAAPIVEALMALGTTGEVDSEDRLRPTDMRFFSPTFTSQNAAHVLITRGMRIVDPESLVFAVTSCYPPEILAATQRTLERVRDYLRGQPFES